MAQRIIDVLRAPSCAATPHRTGTPCRCCASAAARARRARAPRPRRRRSRSCPRSAVRGPAMQRKVVVLPQPDGPSSTTISPAAMRKLTSSTAGRPTSELLAQMRDDQFGGHSVSPFPARDARSAVPANRGIPSSPALRCPRLRQLACAASPVSLTADTRKSCSIRRAMLLQLHELFVFRHPHLHDLRIETFRIERRLL